MNKQARPVGATSRLGRGLSSLIHTTTAVDDPPPAEYRTASPSDHDRGDGEYGKPLEIAVEAVAPNPHQPRRTFAPEALAELTASIRQQGVLQPVLVVRAAADDGQAKYTLIAGERRLRAAKEAGLTTIPCVIREASDQQMLEWSLIENIQRSDLNAIERAQAYRHYMDSFGLTAAEVADRMGESRPNVTNYLRVLDLCDDVQAMLLDGRLSFGHARALAALAGQAELQQKLALRIVDEGLSVRQTEQITAAARDAQAPAGAKARKAAGAKPPYVLDLESQLTRAIGTRVLINPGQARNTGRIMIDYYSLDDFDRISAMLGLASDDPSEL
jgi:ParB family chromosome partitioning protein